MSAFTVANHVGRLIEIRVVPPLSMDDATRFLQDVVRLTSAQPGKIVCCTDLRTGTRTIDPNSIDFIAAIMRSENPSSSATRSSSRRCRRRSRCRWSAW